MFPFLPFLRFSECHCSNRPECFKAGNIPCESECETTGSLDYNYLTTVHIPTAIKIEIRELTHKQVHGPNIRRQNDIFKELPPENADLPSTSLQQTDHVECTETSEECPTRNDDIIDKRMTSPDFVPEDNVTENSKAIDIASSSNNSSSGVHDTGTVSNSQRIHYDVLKTINESVKEAVVEIDHSTVESAPDYSNEAWPQPSSKPRFSADFNMSMEMSFAVGNESDEDESDKDEIFADFKAVEQRVRLPENKTQEMETSPNEKAIDSIADLLNNDAPLSIISITELSDEKNIIEANISVIAIKKEKEEILLESEKQMSRCLSAASTASSVPPKQTSTAASPRCATTSPAKSPTSSQLATAAPVNTPPAVRAARARQRAFQPSQAMLDLFCAPDEAVNSTSTNHTKDTNKKNKTLAMLSQPGPELVESDASDVIVSVPDEEQNMKKSKRSARGRNESGAEIIQDGIATLTKMQLSDPGPEMASESEEADETAGTHTEEALEVNEPVIEQDTCKETDKLTTNEAFPEEITHGATKIDDEEDGEIDDNVPSISDESENEHVEIVIEYDAFGRRFEKEVRKRKEKDEKEGKFEKGQQKSANKNNKIEKTKRKMQEKNVDTAAHYKNAGTRQQKAQQLQQSARGVSARSMHENKSDDNNNNSTTAHSTFARQQQQQRVNRGGGGRNDDENNKTVVHNITANEWNAENYRHHRGRQTREQQQEQQFSTVADIFKESSATAPVKRVGAGRNAAENAGGNLSGSKAAGKFPSSPHSSSSQLRNLGDESKRKTPASSPRTPARTSGAYDKTAARLNTNVSNFYHSSGSSQTVSRITDCGGGGGGDPVMMNGNGNADAVEGASGGGGGQSGHVILIRKANIVNEDEIFSADVLIEDGIITKISNTITTPANAETIEATGFWLLPAGIDAHTQFSREASSGAALSLGTKSALAGGTTTIIETVSARSGETLAAAVDRVRRITDGNSKCHYGFSVVVVGTWNDQIRGQMTEVVCEKSVNSFILNFSSDTGTIEALEHARQIGAQCCLLPDNPTIANLLQKHNRGGVDALIKLEAERIQRYCVFSQLTNAPFVLMCPRINSQVKNAIHDGRADGSLINAEIPLKSLASEYGSLESKSETDHALELLSDGVLSMIISNDLSEIWAPPAATTANGSPSYGTLAAVENRLSLLWEHGVIGAARLDPMRFVAVTSANVAKTFNMFPKKGRVSVGSDADLVLWNFDASRRLGNSTVHCTPNMVICGGDIVVRNGQLVNSDANTKRSNSAIGAKFVGLPSHSPYLFSMVDLKEKTFSMAQLSLSAQRNVKSIEAGVSDASRCGSVASSCISAATTSEAFDGNERKPSAAGSVGHHAESNHPIIPGARNRNQQSTNAPKRSATKVIQPPGGPSTKFW